LTTELIEIGWREWVRLPELGLPRIKVKVDTGAKTSCLHAFEVEAFDKGNEKWVRFGVHPIQDNTTKEVYCESKIVDERIITDSGGHKDKRYVISTMVGLGESTWPIEITLTNRDNMKFRMLLGRGAMLKRFTVNPAASFLLGKSR
jgi:hypothetical protein